MTRDEFLSLPPGVALGLLYDLNHSTLCTVPAQTASTSAPTPTGDARPPKYDGKLGRKGGYVWMSEMLLHDLTWWLEKKREGAASGGQYAQRDAKLVTELERWVAWRTAAPSATWSGIRSDRQATAAPPSRDPTLHPWGDRPPQRLAPPPANGSTYDDRDYGGGNDEEIPF